MEREEEHREKKEVEGIVEKKEELPDKKGKLTEKMRENPWILSTLVLGIVTLIFLIGNFSGGMTGGVISGGDIESLALDFFNNELSNNPGEIISVEEVSGIYKIVFSSNDDKFPLYFTKDGYWISQGKELVPIAEQVSLDSESTDSQDIPKSDKPVLEAFLSPYCPYGLQYMKGLIPVFDLLKNSADIRIKYIGVTHMNLEELETTRQLCILNEYNKEKLFDYLRNIIYNDGAKVCYNDWHSGEYARDDAYFTECMIPIIKNALNKINVDENKINDCIRINGEKYYQEAVDYSRESGVSASPTPKVNDVKVSGRSPEVIKQAICSAFNQEPEECSAELSSTTLSPGIGSEAGSNSQSQC